MSIVLLGSTSGSITLQEPAVAGTTTLNLPTISGPVGVLVSGTAVASTSGTSIDFTSIPAGVRRITVMFSGVSTNGTSYPLIQLGSGSVETSGYSGVMWNNGSGIIALSALGMSIASANASAVINGHCILTNISGNTWVASITMGATVQLYLTYAQKTTSGSLDRIRITTVNGTDTFDAGSINILYE